MRWWLHIVLVCLAPIGAQAQSLGAARTFVKGLYEAYQIGETDYLDTQSGAVFTPALRSLIKPDTDRTPPGYVGALDFDPICACQDPDGIRVGRIVLKPVGPGKAEATVTLLYLNSPRTVRLDLANVAGDWRVADVHTSDRPSLTALLRRVKP